MGVETDSAAAAFDEWASPVSEIFAIMPKAAGIEQEVYAQIRQLAVDRDREQKARDGGLLRRLAACRARPRANVWV